jgi:cobyrinic acid a,c-diamide synthase
MAGLLPVETSFSARKLSLGYRMVKLAVRTSFGAAGTAFRGHEFHYATVTIPAESPLFEARDGANRPLPPAGCRAGAVSGSFIHLIDRAETPCE